LIPKIKNRRPDLLITIYGLNKTLCFNSLRWNYPDQVIRVCLLKTLSALTSSPIVLFYFLKTFKMAGPFFDI